MKKVYIVTRQFHKRGETDDVRINIGCFASYKEAEDAILGIMESINNGKKNNSLVYKEADWGVISGTSWMYVNADVYKEGKLYGKVTYHIEEMEVGKLVYGKNVLFV